MFLFPSAPFSFTHQFDEVKDIITLKLFTFKYAMLLCTHCIYNLLTPSGSEKDIYWVSFAKFLAKR